MPTLPTLSLSHSLTILIRLAVTVTTTRLLLILSCPLATKRLPACHQPAAWEGRTERSVLGTPSPRHPVTPSPGRDLRDRHARQCSAVSLCLVLPALSIVLERFFSVLEWQGFQPEMTACAKASTHEVVSRGTLV